MIRHDLFAIGPEGGILYHGLRIGPLNYLSMRSTSTSSDRLDPTRYLFVGRFAVARGPLYGITDTVERGTRVRILRAAHPSWVLTLAPAEGQHDEDEDDLDGWG